MNVSTNPWLISFGKVGRVIYLLLQRATPTAFQTAYFRNWSTWWVIGGRLHPKVQKCSSNWESFPKGSFPKVRGYMGYTVTLPKTKSLLPKNGSFSIGISFSRGLFSGAMLVSGRVKQSRNAWKHHLAYVPLKLTSLVLASKLDM